MTGMAQDAASVDAEEQLDLVDPAGVNRGEVEDELVIVSGVEIIPHGLRAVGVQVVPHTVHLPLGVGLREITVVEVPVEALIAAALNPR